MRGVLVQRIFPALILLTLCTTLVGCWDQRPVETRGAVAAIGVDPGSRPGVYRFTVVFPNVTTTASSLATTPSDQEFFHYTVQEPNLTAALAAVQRRQSRSLYLGQIRILALSTRLAPTVWGRVMRSAVQSGRMVLTFAVVGTPNAQALVSLSPHSEVVPELALYRALTCHCQPILVANRAWRVWAEMETPGVTPDVSHVGLQDAGFVIRGIDLVTPRAIMSWSLPQTWGWAYFTGHVNEGSLTVAVAGHLITVGRIRGRIQQSFTVVGHQIQMHNQLTYTGQLVSGGDALGNPLETDQRVDQAVAVRLLALCQQALATAEASAVDPFGWHRDLQWTHTDAGVCGDTWSCWRVTTAVHFRVRNEGILR